MTDHQAKLLWIDLAPKFLVGLGRSHPVETCGCAICYRYRVMQAQWKAEAERRHYIKGTILNFLDTVMIAGALASVAFSSKVAFIIFISAATFGSISRIAFIHQALRHP